MSAEFPPQLRIISLIPSATEILALLGLGDRLVGRSHECDYPDAVKHMPICTEPKFNPEGTSHQIHDRVTDLLQSALSVYRVKTEVLEALQPTHIITQAQCEVCAVSLADVELAVDSLTHSHPQIISLQPNVLADVWTDIQRVADVLGVNSNGIIEMLQSRISACQNKINPLPNSHRPTVACIEWIEPLMAAGNWMPELVQLAGGKPLFGEIGKHSPWLQWEDLLKADPDIVILMPCGFDLARTHQEAMPLVTHPDWAHLKAVQLNQIYITDGNAYFNRPGPRLVDSLEILAEIVHPELFAFGYRDRGWQNLTAHQSGATPQE
ncbi:MAG: cobalamin-binding protein [Pseudanabaena sp. CRU_2_10]|nr:cobalamin-binding protein [Pseudanabaena sp. CRU_2_10]